MSPLTFTQEQAQKLTEIGAHLRSIRTKKGLALEDLAAKTMIQPRFLTSIEQGKIEELPEALYVRGFVRRYAEALGLDGIQISENFPLGEDHPSAANSRMMAANGAVPLRPWHIYLIYLAAVLAAVTGLYFLLRPQGDSRSDEAGKSKPAAVAPAPAKPKAAPKPAVAKPKPKTAPVQAQLTLKQDSWVEITADGQAVPGEILKAGTTKTVTAKQGINIYSGNAGGVMLSINGQPAKAMGQAGQPKEVTLSPTSR